MTANIWILALLSVAFIGAGCGKDRPKKRAARPCTVGVNRSTCADGISGTSLWSRHLKRTDAQDPNKVVETLDLFYEFTRGTEGPSLVKTLIVRQDGQPARVMIVRGRITEITSDFFDYSVEHNPCQVTTATQAPAARRIFFRRDSTDILRIDQSPVPPPPTAQRVRNPGDIFGQMIGTIVGAMFQAMFEAIAEGTADALRQAFGGNYYVGLLEKDRGAFAAANTSTLTVGTLGCFENRGFRALP